MGLRNVYEAPTVFRCLNGMICAYKPPGKKVSHVKNSIIFNLCKDLNQLEVRKPRRILAIESDGLQGQILRKIKDYSDDILAVGPRYQVKDIQCSVAANLGVHTSGILLIGLNSGTKLTYRIHQNRPIRVYHITGCLGRSTESCFSDSLLTARATYHHVTERHFSAMISSLQASHQRQMYEMLGLDLQSQEAYEIACKGLIRPTQNQQPVIYGIRLINYNKPDFTLEVHAINENEAYLGTLVHEIGVELKALANCKSIRCIRHGHFNIEDTLLRRHWNLQGVLSNMRLCIKILKEHPNLLKQSNVQLTSE